MDIDRVRRGDGLGQDGRVRDPVARAEPAAGLVQPVQIAFEVPDHELVAAERGAGQPARREPFLGPDGLPGKAVQRPDMAFFIAHIQIIAVGREFGMR